MLPNFKSSQADSPGQPAPSSQPSLGAHLSGVSSAADERVIVPSVIGPDLKITGDLETKGELQIDGEVEGEIHGSSVVIGKKGRITGGIVAEEIVVRGQVMGSIHGKRVLLQSSSRVEADIFHESLVIEDGASFEGRLQRSLNPTADAVPLETAIL